MLVNFHNVATSRACVTYSKSVDEAFCAGWIDNTWRPMAKHLHLIRFTRRRACVDLMRSQCGKGGAAAR